MSWFNVLENEVNGKKFDVVFVNGSGAFIARKNEKGGYNPILDSGSEYIAAPQNWRDLAANMGDDEDKFSSGAESIVIISE